MRKLLIVSQLLPQVKFTLKRRTDSHHSSAAVTTTSNAAQHHQSQSHTLTCVVGDRDSGRGSPTGSINSAIVRRRRHRASRSTFAWMTHGQTIHPKSQKNNIERLMKLILEQGEVIQQQLAKLRLVKLLIKKIPLLIKLSIKRIIKFPFVNNNGNKMMIVKL
jgi:Ras association domain-containing protein 9/10